MRKSNVLLLSVISGLLVASTVGCSGNGPAPGGNVSVAQSPGVAPPRPTPSQVATTAPTPGSATPGASSTPGGSGSPAAGGGDLDKAKGQPGVAEVQKMGKNPVAGDAAATEKGKALFAQNCASCHGDAGNGDGPAGAALDPKPRNLHKGTEFRFGAGDLAVFRTIKYGVEGSGMAPWDGRMSDDECWQVVNFVKTLQGG